MTVVGVDDSPGSRAALGWAVDHARAPGKTVITVNFVVRARQSAPSLGRNERVLA
jgi:nucleotide-binding universal stress UspA family protein